MSLVIENVAIDAAAFTVANILEDLAAATRHKIPADKPKARILLAAWIRTKREELIKAVAPIDALGDAAAGAQMIKDAAAIITAERAHLARVQRERREQQQAEREAMLAMMGEGELVAA